MTQAKENGILREIHGGGIITGNHIVEADGMTRRERNMLLQHNIPLYSLVEILGEGTCSGLRLYVAHHTRDCDGTPLYALTFEIEREPLGISLPESEPFLDKVLRHWMNGYTERSLKVINGPEVAIAKLKDAGWIKPDGSWYER